MADLGTPNIRSTIDARENSGAAITLDLCTPDIPDTIEAGWANYVGHGGYCVGGGFLTRAQFGQAFAATSWQSLSPQARIDKVIDIESECPKRDLHLSAD